MGTEPNAGEQSTMPHEDEVTKMWPRVGDFLLVSIYFTYTQSHLEKRSLNHGPMESMFSLLLFIIHSYAHVEYSIMPSMWGLF